MFSLLSLDPAGRPILRRPRLSNQTSDVKNCRSSLIDAFSWQVLITGDRN